MARVKLLLSKDGKSLNKKIKIVTNLVYIRKNKKYNKVSPKYNLPIHAIWNYQKIRGEEIFVLVIKIRCLIVFYYL